MKTLASLLAAALALAFAPGTASARDHHRGHRGHSSHSHRSHSGHHHHHAPRYVQPSGYYVTKVVGYDHCGRPIYRRVWVSTCSPGVSFSFGFGR